MWVDSAFNGNRLQEAHWYHVLLAWREKYIPTQRFVLLLSFLVGVFTALAAALLKEMIHFVQNLLTEHFNSYSENYLYLLYPVVGIFLSAVFVRYIVRDDISHGVTRILCAISQNKSRMKPHNMFTSMVASSVTIGFGGSVGAEAPVVLTGSAIGSTLGSFFKMDQKTLMLMVGCGAAGAISGIFKAPIAGVVFTLEVLMLDMTFSSIVPLLISSITAVVISYYLSSDAVLFSMNEEAFQLGRIPWYLLLGVICGFVSLYFTRGMNALENLFHQMDVRFGVRAFWVKMGVGGAMLSGLIFFFPPLYGEGYDSISSLLNLRTTDVFENSLFYNFHSQWYWVVVYLSLIFLFKIVASAATNAAGGCGGIFAPSLFVGCFSGFVVALLLRQLGLDVPEQNFALAGMAGLMSGVMHAPLTGIFLIAELSGGYALFVPLTIVSVISYCTIILFEPHSLYAMRLAQRGELITHHKDKAVLSFLKTESVLETDLQTIRPEAMFGDLIKLISQSKRNIFPVVDAENRLVGMITLEEIRNIMFRPELYNRFRVRKLMVAPPAVVTMEESMESVLKKFETTHAWNLPVVDDSKHYKGFVSKSALFNAYREMLVEMSDD